MSKKAAKKLLEQAKATTYEYEIGGKPVSEFKFFLNLRREMRGEQPKKSFYWTDKKVVQTLKIFGIRITDEDLTKIKNNLQ